MRIRRAIPWVVSFAVHAALAVVAASVLTVTPVIPQRIIGVDVQLVSHPGGKTRAGSNPVQRAAGNAADRAGSARTVGTPGAPTTPTDAGRSAVPHGPATGVVPYVGQGQTSDSTLPSTRDVLSDLAATTQGPSPSVETGGGGPFRWEGAPRTLIRRRDPQFPVILSAAGQEVEVEARITVAPSGVVKRVEITRSSGYIEIDASVEAALRDYLFSRVNGRTDTVGTRRFRFLVEKLD
jgi:TonB family protein